MATIGRTDIATTATVRADGAMAQTGLAAVYTAVAADVVTLFSIYGGLRLAGYWTAAIYTAPLGTPVTRIHAPVTITPTSAVPQWWTSAVNIPLVAGTNYLFAIGMHGGPTQYEDSVPLPRSSMDNDNTPGTPWSEASLSSKVASAFATVGAAPPPATTIYYPCKAQLIT